MLLCSGPFCYLCPSRRASVHATAQNETTPDPWKTFSCTKLPTPWPSDVVWGIQINRLCSLTYTSIQSDHMPTEILAHLLTHSLSNVRFHLTADGRTNDQLPFPMYDSLGCHGDIWPGLHRDWGRVAETDTEIERQPVWIHSDTDGEAFRNIAKEEKNSSRGVKGCDRGVCR